MMLPDDGKQLRSRAVPRDVRKALQYIRGAIGEKTSMVDLARICGVAERTLYKHFRQFVGLTPQNYQRRLRLAAAREMLQDPGSDEAITGIAMHLGFTHFGRFSSEYRKVFAELPSRTRMRHRAAAARVDWEAGEKPPPPILIPEPMCAPALRCRPAIAVLPFQTSGLPLEQRDFCDSVAEHLASGLCRMHSTSVHLAPGRRQQSEWLPRRVGTRYCLTGRVSGAGKRVRVIVRLLDMAADRHLWGDAYDGVSSDLHGLQDRVLEDVVRCVPARIQAAEVAGAHQHGPEDVSHQHGTVLRALPLALAADPASARRALGVLELGMHLDPDNGSLPALAAWCHAQLVLYHGTDRLPQEKATAIRLADQAAALASCEFLVLTARSVVHSMVGDWDTAEYLVTRALAMDPTCEWGWERSGWLHINAGRPEIALTQFRRALRMKAPGSAHASSLAGIGFAHINLGRDREGALWIRRALAENPGAVWLHRTLAPCYVRLGEPAAARASLAALRRTCPGITAKTITDALPCMDNGTCRALIADGLAALGMRH